MSKATNKLQSIMQLLKKLPASRRAFWLKKLKALLPQSQGYVEADDELGDWLLDTANWLDKVYSSAADQIDENTLYLANSVDKIYNTVADEAKKVPAMIGTGASNLVKPLTVGEYWPYLLGAGVALGVTYYVTKMMPR